MSKGTVRNLDSLGRVVIPAEMREMLHIGKGEPVSITTDGISITVRKYAPGCTFCDSLERLDLFMGKQVCQKCKAKITEGKG